MPQEQVTVYYKDTGEAIRMHSVDAQEALNSGAYSRLPPEAPVTADPEASAEPESGDAPRTRGRR